MTEIKTMIEETKVAAEELYELQRLANRKHGILSADKKWDENDIIIQLTDEKFQAISNEFDLLHVYDDKTESIPIKLVLKDNDVQYLIWTSREKGCEIIASFKGEKEYVFKEDKKEGEECA